MRPLGKCRGNPKTIRQPSLMGSLELHAVQNGKKYDSVDGSLHKAKRVHSLLAKRAEQLEQGAVAHQAKP